MMLIAAIVGGGPQPGDRPRQRLPWRLPADLKRFKRLTMGHALVMGRKTYESMAARCPAARCGSSPASPIGRFRAPFG